MNIVDCTTKEDLEMIKQKCKQVNNLDISSFDKWWTYILFCNKKNNNKCFIRILKEKDEIIGFYAALYKIKSRVIKLYAIATFKPETRGIGKILFDDFIVSSKELNGLYCEFDSDERFSGFHFFTHRYGFKPIKKKDDTHWYFKIGLQKNVFNY